MGHLSIWHWLVVLVIVLLLFGRGKISEVMGDVAKGVKSFKRGMAEDDEPTTATAANTAKQVEATRAAVVTPTPEERKVT